MRNTVLGWFEALVDPFPQAESAVPPARFVPFLWFCTRGLRRYLFVLMLLTALIGSFEALLFAMLGHIVDWLGARAATPVCRTPRRPAGAGGRPGRRARWPLRCRPCVKHQALAGNFPMRLRWNFHRLMLGQSMGFYQDEFAGRVATKVMQTALAVRDTWLTVPTFWSSW